MSTVTSRDGTVIGYDRAGTGPALILVEGAFCFRGSGPTGPLAALLADRFTTYTYDRRGRGESGDTQPYAVDREVEDLAALVEAAGGAAYLYGVSSGAVLAVLAAAAGLNVPRLVLFEPPPLPEAPAGTPGQPAAATLAGELAALVAAGRRGDAVERFQLAIGLPPEVVTGMRQAPFRPALEAVAHTLAYDTTVTAALCPAALAAVHTPALLLASEHSSPVLLRSAQAAADALPHGRYRSLPGGFHDVPPDVLAPVVAEFLAA